MRRLALAAAIVALLPATSAHGQVEAIEPTFQLDRRRDVRGPLDVVRVAMSTRLDGSLRGEVKLRRRWDTADLGDGGSVCLKLYVRADPGAAPPEYMVCATPPAEGDSLAGRVLRMRGNGAPRTVGEAAVTRPTRRTAFFRFDSRAIRRPARLRFSAETTWRGRKCPRATGCVDLAPDPPDAREFRLRRDAQSG